MPTIALGSGVISAPQVGTSPGLRGPSPSRGRVAIPVVAGLVTLAAIAAAVIAFMMLGHRRQPPQVEAIPPSATASPVPVAPPPEPASAIATAAPPPSTTAPVPTTAVTLLPLAAPPRAPIGPAPVVAAPPRQATTAPTARPAADCNPPYYFNAQGDRLFKKDCL